jgi:tRNA-Thr(GGU) m(6)t(6)A37 methyltransferase TsaA
MTQVEDSQRGKRDGEIELAEALVPDDAGLAFIGVVRSPWIERSACPKNMNAARETGLGATIEVAQPFRPGLAGLAGYSHAVVLTWFDRSERNLIVQKPRHASDPKGVFALRSPARPNPIGLHVVELLGIDVEAGILTLDAIDTLDATPVLDIKPYFASTDAFPHATRPDKREP